MNDLSMFEVWMVTGSQHLYGEETLQQAASDARIIAGHLNDSAAIPVKIIYQPVVTTPEEITQTIRAANQHKQCIGIIAWMHTFSPAKMWITGLKHLQKPLLHLHTQFHRDIPWSDINMDYMNLHQSAHGDREFGFMLARMRLQHKIVTGHWKEHTVQHSIGAWCRAAAGWNDWQEARFCRFGDNMRQVAVTEGDKVEAELKLGFSVNSYGIGDLVSVVNEVDESLIDNLVKEYADNYELMPELRKGGDKHASLRSAAKIELGLRAFLEQGSFKGFTDTFEDLHGLEQLPGIAVQRLMAAGYGFAAEGDWKTAALVRAMKVMASGLKGGNSFMEDYTYHFEPGHQQVLGAHMLEICPSISNEKIRCEIHPLGIGGKKDPVRLVFNADHGPALNASLIDMGNRFRLLVNTVEAVAPTHTMPKLPVARVLWKPHPDMNTGCSAWLLSGGAHHTCFSQNLDAEILEDFAIMAGVEYILINKETRLNSLRNELKWNEMYYALNKL